ncbi:diguanylate cyclase domain-containing protein [Methylibium sp.]|uniref:diguanylate cyclase domain-containing protein n=1 Tax=Methylibium sp. TaxID=2067992 RepID=UPI003D0BA84D
MNAAEIRLLVVGPVPGGLAASAWGPFAIERCDSLEEAAARLRDATYDAVLIQLADVAAAERLPVWPALSQACAEAAVLLVTAAPGAPLVQRLIERGVQDVLPQAEASAERLALAVHLAIGRQRIERAARKAYATDLATGLPNQMQLLEHVNHLLALREREPAPMALLVIRIEGLTTAEAALGVAAAGALRRKLAVRLRAALRASDVVASVGADAFAALLAWIDTPTAADRVAAKLVRSMSRPVRLGGQEVAVAVSAGIGRYPEHGKDAQTLLRQAFAEAAGAVPLGRAGFSNRVERGPASAANDET